MRKMMPILAHLIVWAILILIFWVTPLYDDAMGYSVLALYVVMPVSTIITSFLIGRNEEWKRKKFEILMVHLHVFSSSLFISSRQAALAGWFARVIMHTVWAGGSSVKRIMTISPARSCSWAINSGRKAAPSPLHTMGTIWDIADTKVVG